MRSDLDREYLEHKLNYVLGAASLPPEQMAKRKACLVDDLMVIIDPERRAREQAVIAAARNVALCLEGMPEYRSRANAPDREHIIETKNDLMRALAALDADADPEPTCNAESGCWSDRCRITGSCRESAGEWRS